jgi:nuclear cap-binding protein subunit 1
MPKDTFKPLPSTTEDPAASTSTVSLESLVVSTILSAMFTLPKPPYDLIYYGSVITELCKLSPNTVAPPVGRAVRKLFTMLGSEGLDNEIARRAAEWFAVHLSNFGFQWMWKEWYAQLSSLGRSQLTSRIPDLELPSAHPRRAFIRKVVDSEVRLAYHNRILQTLPEQMQAKEAEVIGEDPQPLWPYEREGELSPGT